MTTRWILASQVLCAEMDGVTRLVDGSAGPGYEYGRLEIFVSGFWSNVCNNDRFTPDAAEVACRALGYGGGAALRFTQSYANSLSPVRRLPCVLHRISSRCFDVCASPCIMYKLAVRGS